MLIKLVTAAILLTIFSVSFITMSLITDALARESGFYDANLIAEAGE